MMGTHREPHPRGLQRQLSGREEHLCWGRAEGVRKEERNGFQAEEVTRAKVRRRGGLPRGNDEPEQEQQHRAACGEERPPRAAQEGVRPEQSLFTVGQEFPMVLSPGHTGRFVRR